MGEHRTAHPGHQGKRRAVGSSAQRWLLILFGLAAGVGTWAVLEFVVWNNLPSEMVGKWEVVDGRLEGATFDFYRSGKMIGRINQGGNLAIIKAMVRVEGDKLYTTTWKQQTGEERTTVQSIRTLSAREFVVQDFKGVRTNMRRRE